MDNDKVGHFLETQCTTATTTTTTTTVFTGYQHGVAGCSAPSVNTATVVPVYAVRCPRVVMPSTQPAPSPLASTCTLSRPSSRPMDLGLCRHDAPSTVTCIDLLFLRRASGIPPITVHTVHRERECARIQRAFRNFCNLTIVQGDHLSGKPGNVREFETCQGNVMDVVNSQGIVREKSCHGKVSQNCSYTNMHSFYAHTLNNNTIYLTLTTEVLATVYLNISISFKKTVLSYIYTW